MIKIKNLIDSIKSAPKDFPVETIMGLTFTIAGALESDNVINCYPIFFAVILFVITFTFRKINKPIYYASYLLVWVVQWLIQDFDFFDQAWFWVLNIVAVILLLSNLRQNDNKRFAQTAMSKFGILFYALFLAGILSLMVSAIVGSLMYLFSGGFWHLLLYCNLFIWFTFFPLIYCTLYEKSEFLEKQTDDKFLRIVVDYILSPSLVIYTFILFVYILKIVLIQELPRGGVAYMVSIYIALVLVGNLLNKFLKISHFDWFYNNFAFIVIAPLILQWIGVVYRINEYGLTESRVYLLIINVLVTIFPLMLKFNKTNRYNLLTIVVILSMVIFTCIPPISAKNIGIRNQYSRFVNHAKQIGVFDTSTWTLKDDFDVEKFVNQDSIKMKQYLQLQNEYYFLRSRTDSIREKYSSWNHWYITTSTDDDTLSVVYLSKNVDIVPLDGFNLCYGYNKYYSNGVVTVKNSKHQTVLEYDVQETLKVAGKRLYSDPLSVLKFHNDSIMIIIEEIQGNFNDDFLKIYNVYPSDIQVFKK